jgi:hypothetical protein
MSIKLVGVKRLLTNLTRVLTRVEKQTQKLPKILAVEYVQLVKQKIISQDFSYAPLSPAYEEWKAEHYPGAKTWWHLGGDLVKAIDVIRFSATSYAGTISPSAMDTGHKSYYRDTETSILLYALSLEYGVASIDLPPRPLFGPAAVEYVSSAAMASQIDKAMVYIATGWRN